MKYEKDDQMWKAVNKLITRIAEEMDTLRNASREFQVDHDLEKLRPEVARSSARLQGATGMAPKGVPSKELLEEFIRDAEWRIGSYIATGCSSSQDKYVQEQIAKIRVWAELLDGLPQEDVQKYRQSPDLSELDAAYLLAHGAYAIPMDENGPVHDYRKLLEYCRERGIDPSELSEEEIRKFEIKK